MKLFIERPKVIETFCIGVSLPLLTSIAGCVPGFFLGNSPDAWYLLIAVIKFLGSSV